MKWKAFFGVLLIIAPYAFKLGWQLNYVLEQAQYEKNCSRKIEIPVCRGQCQIQKQLVQIELGQSSQKPSLPSSRLLGHQLFGAIFTYLEPTRQGTSQPFSYQLPRLETWFYWSNNEPRNPPPQFV